MNKYSFSEALSTIAAYMITKLCYPKARLIRRPFYIRGKRNLEYKNGLTTGHACRFDLSGEGTTLRIGENCRMGDNVHIVAYNDVVIGNNVLMASKVFISDTNHGSYNGKEQSSPLEAPNDRILVFGRVSIGDNVWIGDNVCILSGVKIGSGVVIGANSVVTHDIPDNTIAVGSPAKAIKAWDEEKKQWIRI